MSASPIPIASGSTAKQKPRSGTPSGLPAAFQAPIHQPSPKAQLGGIFTSDGSFLERFRKSKEEETEKQKIADALAKAKAEEDRIKNRGKRKVAREDSASASPAPEDREAKKARADDSDSAYQRELNKSKNSSLKEQGSGHRPMVK